MPAQQASHIFLSSCQQEFLERMVSTTRAHRLVKRGQIILEAAKGCNNTHIAQHLRVDVQTVRYWRDRWHAAQLRMQSLEAEGNPEQLRQAILALLDDTQRPGTPATFTREQLEQITALCHEPSGAPDQPVRNWTPRALAEEGVKRGIVPKISPRTVARFLKGK